MPSYAKNKKAYHDYEILDEYECGIVLNGDEVKSIKGNQANLKGSHIVVENDAPYIIEAHISRYKNSCNSQNDPTRKRKLLLHKKQINKVEQALAEAGKAVIPLELYSKQGLIKIRIGICRGKQLHDKRDTLKKRSQEKEIRKQIKDFNG